MSDRRLPEKRAAEQTGTMPHVSGGAPASHDRGAAAPQIGPVGPGVAVALLVALVATGLGTLAPVIGGPVCGIVLGMLAGRIVPGLRAPVLTRGYAFASSTVLQASIVVLGTGLSLSQVASVGSSSLPVMVGTLAVALGGAWLIGRRLGLDRDLTTLIGVGTGICGASAIAAVTAVTRPKERDVAYAIGTIFTFNIAAVLLFPPIGHLLGMDGHAFGLWAGTAVNDTSSVVAAAYSFGAGAGPYAIVVKLCRTLMIIPIVIGLALLRARREHADRVGLPWRRVVPPFLVGFVVAAAVNSTGVIPSGWHPALTLLGSLLITVALSGIGLSLRLSTIRQAGHRPLLLGGLLWLLVAATSLGLQALTGTL